MTARVSLPDTFLFSDIFSGCHCQGPILQRSVHNSWKLKTHNDDRCYSFDSGDTGVTEDGG